MSHVVLAMLKCFLRISLTTWQATLHPLHHPRLSAASAATIAAPMIWWILWWAWQPCLATFCHPYIHWHLHTVIQLVVPLSFLSWTFMILCLTMVMCDTTLSAIHLLPNFTRPPRSHPPPPLQQPRKWHALGVVVSQVPLATMAHACSHVLLTVVARCLNAQSTLSVTFDPFIPLKNVSCLLCIYTIIWKMWKLTNGLAFECPYQSCSKRFSRSDNLNQHIRIHRHSSSAKDNTKPSMAATSGAPTQPSLVPSFMWFRCIKSSSHIQVSKKTYKKINRLGCLPSEETV